MADTVVAGAVGPVAGESPRRRAWAAAAAVVDPEVPVLTIADLGVLRSVEVSDDGAVRVAITPTYSGCPAVETIRDDVVDALRREGFAEVRVDLVLSPAWTTDGISEDGRRKLREYGIAPPTGRSRFGEARPRGPVPVEISVPCPRCGSLDTRELSRFGSTACKALYECRACSEPFDHFKVH
ncbi:1,2-phenylacetyl-CoA epoxidase subunit PaaD [Myceligenerans crystallogenes]|uniref:1,2-phenylacetyl-CoA epoxidase subunit PaaD n=1 Tax=Myceligenerans crystallogenes TaxID=316335 RepID=UPI003CD096CF